MGSSASSGKLAIPRKHSSVSLQHFLPYFILILNLLNLISNLIPRKHPSVSLQHFLCPIFASHLMNMMALQEQGLRCSRFEQERAQETREFSLIGLSRPVLQEDAETWEELWMVGRSRQETGFNLNHLVQRHGKLIAVATCCLNQINDNKSLGK